RLAAIADAGYNVFDLASDDVYVDLLTDSGTGAMSQSQWAALVGGDEAYAGSDSFDRLREAVADVIGFERIVPAHQGRGAENVLYGAMLSEGDVAISNTHFDTTRAHVVNQGAEPIDCPRSDALAVDSEGDFLGDLDLDRARSVVDERGHESVAAVILTLTNNSVAGQPVSVANVRSAREFADEIDAHLVLDACRFAENAAFVARREPEFADIPVAEIVREQLSYADAVVVSGKKDSLANVGGFVCIAPEHDDLLARAKQRGILYEGFTTYGGMAGRDLAAMATGLREAVDPDYLDHRLGQIETLADRLDAGGTPVYRPVGGHAVYVDAGEIVSLPREQFPGQGLTCAFYEEGAVRPVELGGFAFPGTDRPDLVRFALPRRRYHREHFDHVQETAARVADRAAEGTIPGLEIVDEPPMEELRHFSADLRPIDGDADVDAGDR
ncbi:tyrosine phenol-lyase, partial [Halobacteriales archaeon SW_7_68_16]